MLPPETHEETADATELVTVPDVDTIEARLARMEFMLAELYSLVEVAKPAVTRVAEDIRDKGAAGLLGMMLGRG